MGAIQQQWHRLRCGSLEDDVLAHRAILMQTAFRLYNYRTREVGLNQIQSYWFELLEQDYMEQVYQIGS